MTVVLMVALQQQDRYGQCLQLLYDSSRSLMTKDQQARIALFHEQIALLLTKNEQIARKTDERIPNPGFHQQLLKNFCTNSISRMFVTAAAQESLQLQLLKEWLQLKLL